MSFDLREYKKELRAKFRSMRTDLTEDEKSRLDNAVLQRILSSDAYKSCRILLTYVSTPIEVDTRELVAQAVSDGKKVAVPKCVPDTRLMEFFYIESIDELEPGTFSVLEPVRGIPARNFKSALCIVPGLGFDMKGYRLGYGKGYYDRFLAEHPDMLLMGVCYCGCTVQELIHGRYDRKVDLLTTEKYIKTIT